MNVKDKVAIVTGASSGIGLATAKLLSKNGAKVVLAARSLSKLQKLSKELPDSLAIQVDMTDERQIKNLVQKTLQHFGRVDILINNAGRGYDASIEETNPDTFRELFNLDVVGPLVAMQEVIPVMQKQGGGSIINISSATALMVLPNMAAYSSLKRALAGISLTAREELKQDNINVGVVYPYITLTDFEKNTLKARQQEEQDWNSDDPDFKPPDTAEYVAEKILEGIKSETVEIFVHDWMKKV
ncbi:MAG TPA: SDR family oxidoreductase [Patescibacteria group bacterium]|jgi:short-subunit dehydrogenase|nr:SDR family oxidoreductase [Patescibacteria group bacterium]